MIEIIAEATPVTTAIVMVASAIANLLPKEPKTKVVKLTKRIVSWLALNFRVK